MNVFVTVEKSSQSYRVEPSQVHFCTIEKFSKWANITAGVVDVVVVVVVVVVAVVVVVVVIVVDFVVVVVVVGAMQSVSQPFAQQLFNQKFVHGSKLFVTYNQPKSIPGLFTKTSNNVCRHCEGNRSCNF